MCMPQSRVDFSNNRMLQLHFVCKNYHYLSFVTHTMILAPVISTKNYKSITMMSGENWYLPPLL